MPSPTWVSQPFLGLWLDLPTWQGDNRSLSACNNVRITNGALTNSRMGWTLLDDIGALNGRITMIAAFPNKNNYNLVIGTPTDIYDWHNGDPVFLTPVYVVGTVDVTDDTVTGTGDMEWTAKMGALGIRNNVMVGDQITFGSSTANSRGANWYTVTEVTSDTVLKIDPPLAMPITGNSYTLRQLAQDDIDYRWSFELFPGAGPPHNNDVFFCANGLDPAITWNGVDLFAKYEADMPFVPHYMQRYKNMMIYGALTQDGQVLYTTIANSDNGLPTELAEGIANQYVVSDGPFQINHLSVLGNNLMVWMGSMDSGSVVAASFVGFPTNFVFNEVIRGRGPIASGTVLEFPDRHEFLSFDGQYRYNGLYTQLMNTHVWRVVLQSFDRSRTSRCYSNIVPQFGLAHLALPLQTDAADELEVAYIENYLEQPSNILFKPITQRDFPFTAVGQLPANSDVQYWNEDDTAWEDSLLRWNDNEIDGAYPNQFAGDADGYLYLLFTEETASPSFATFSQRVLAGERSKALVRRIYPFVDYINDDYSITVTVNLYDQIAGPLARSDTKTMPVDYSGNRFTSHFRRGRVAEVKFSTEGPDEPFNLTGYDWDISSGGLR